MNATIAPETTDPFWTEVDPDIVSTLTDDQKLAISRAVQASPERRTPVDIRFSLGRYFMVFMLGRERRNEDRVKAESEARPAFTVTNIPAIICIWIAVCYMTLTILSAITYLVFGLLG